MLKNNKRALTAHSLHGEYALSGSIKTAAKMKSGTIVTILPDRGDRYLSATLFRSVCADCPP